MYKEYVRKIFVSRVYSTEIVKWSLSEVMCRACRIDYGRPIEICLSNFSTVLTIFFFFPKHRSHRSDLSESLLLL